MVWFALFNESQKVMPLVISAPYVIVFLVRVLSATRTEHAIPLGDFHTRPSVRPLDLGRTKTRDGARRKLHAGDRVGDAVIICRLILNKKAGDLASRPP